MQWDYSHFSSINRLTTMGITVHRATPDGSQKQPHSNPARILGVASEITHAAGAIIFPQLCSPSPIRLTVWCKSLLFHGKGYTVYDGTSGTVVFRVDNYAQLWRGETVLMDCAGGALLTIRQRRQKLGISESWMAYKGDRDALEFAGSKQRPLFQAKKALGTPSCKVSMASNGGEAERPVGCTYRMNWSRQEHWSRIYQVTSSTALPVAEARRKCGARPEVWLGEDVLTLEVQPGMDPAMAVALMIITHAMQ